MKKLIAGLAVAFLMLAGLVAGTATTASAGPYSGTVNTTTNVTARGPITTQQRPRVRVAVRPQQGNGNARGPVRVTFSSQDGKVVRTFRVFYNGSPRTYNFPRLRAARYTVTVTYIGYAQSVYKPSASATRLFVRRAR